MIGFQVTTLPFSYFDKYTDSYNSVLGFSKAQRRLSLVTRFEQLGALFSASHNTCLLLVSQHHGRNLQDGQIEHQERWMRRRFSNC